MTTMTILTMKTTCFCHRRCRLCLPSPFVYFGSSINVFGASTSRRYASASTSTIELLYVVLLLPVRAPHTSLPCGPTALTSSSSSAHARAQMSAHPKYTSSRVSARTRKRACFVCACGEFATFSDSHWQARDKHARLLTHDGDADARRNKAN